MASCCSSLKRSFSTCNTEAAAHLQRYISDQEQAFDENRFYLFKDVTKSCMTIPSLQMARDSQVKMALKSVVDLEVLIDAEEKEIINWWSDARVLLPICVDDKINSVYHAVALYIWGVHDNTLTLRKFVKGFVNGKKHDVCRQYFSHYLGSLLDGENCVDLLGVENVPTWSEMTEMFSDDNLHEQHVKNDMKLGGTSSIAMVFILFVLCNVIGRPIVVLGYNKKQFASIAGIYLPLMRRSESCEKSPVLLLYHNRCFLPLLSCEDSRIPISTRTISENAPHCVPLCQSNLQHLMLPFATNWSSTDSEDKFDLFSCPYAEEYLDLSTVNAGGSKNVDIPVVFLRFNVPPSFSLVLQRSWLEAVHEDLDNRSYPYAEDVQLCSRSTVGCQNVGLSSMKGMCGECYVRYLQVSQSVPKRSSIKKKQPCVTDDEMMPSNAFLPICINPECDKPQVLYLLNRCRSCYLEHVMTEDASSTDETKKLCCYPDCSSMVVSDMDLCKDHLDLLEKQNNVPVIPGYGSTSNPSNFNCSTNVSQYESSRSTGALPGFTQTNVPASGRGVPPLGDQAPHSPFLKKQVLLTQDEMAMENMLGDLLDERDLLVRRQASEEFQLYDKCGDAVGIEALQRCILPECLHFVDEPNSLVCADCAEQQRCSLQTFEEEKCSIPDSDSTKAPTKLCQTPQCALPAINGVDLYCVPCILERFPRGPNSVPVEFQGSDANDLMDKTASAVPLSANYDTLPTCLTPGCDMFGSVKFNGFCSRCYTMN